MSVTNNQKAAGPPATFQDLPRGSETILVVDDEDGLRRPVRRALERQGYVVLEAQNGQQALDHLSGGTAVIDLLVCDVAMPGMTGIELIERIGSSTRTPRILLMSGYADDETLHGNRIPAGTGFLGKPFMIGSLVTAVRDILDRNQMA